VDAQRKKTTSARLAGVVLALSVLLTAACTSGSDPEESALTVAQANLTTKQEALDAANKAADDASAAFCTSASSYITALDRYGDVLDQSAVTVGDVTTAGSDLKQPSKDTEAAAQAVVGAREDVATAEQEVADAEAAVAAAEASASGTEAPEPAAKPTPTPSATIPAATVDRVKQAETDFDSARAGITDDTPLVQASQQFNAAVVALELSWIQLFAQSGCLSDERQAQASGVIRDYTIALQQSLTDAGYYKGPIDGIYGPMTVEAIVALQAANDLPQTGALDKASQAALQAQLDAAGGDAAKASMVATAALQQTLKLAGYWDGAVDGEVSDELTAAVAAAQTDLGVPATGAVDAATIEAFQRALAAVLEPTQSPSPEEPEPTATD
jgi:hypothetical protein